VEIGLFKHVSTWLFLLLAAIQDKEVESSSDSKKHGLQALQTCAILEVAKLVTSSCRYLLELPHPPKCFSKGLVRVYISFIAILPCL